MSGNPKQSPKPAQWRLEWLGHSLIEGLAGMLPVAALFRMGEALGGLAWHLLPERRKSVTRNLRIAFAGELDRAGIHQLAKASFRRTGGNMFAVAHTARLKPDELVKVVEVRGIEHVTAALDQGRGVVVLIPHMGNWEVLSRINLFMPEGTKSGAFYRPLNNPLMDARVLKRREADGTRMFSKHDGPLQATGFLRSNAMLGVLADQRTGHAGELTAFFGRVTRASPLPSLLARRVKCPVVTIANTTLKPGAWRVEFRPVEGPYTTTTCMLALEEAMKASPEDCFWLQDRWKLYFRKGRTIRDWLEGNENRGSKPHRALLWLVSAPETWRIPDTWSHPDVIHEVALTENAPLPAWLPANTRVHRVSNSSDRDTIHRELVSIDDADPLPVDFILTPQAPKALIKAAGMEMIPVLATGA